MRLEEDIKLDYSDVLFRPKRSTLQSRKDVNLKRTYRYRPKILSTSEVIDSDNVHADAFLLDGSYPQANAVDTDANTYFQISHRVTSASSNSNKKFLTVSELKKLIDKKIKY